MNGIGEECVIINLVSRCIDSFKSDILDDVRNFYKNYDPVKSLDKSYILDLLEIINKRLREISEELL